ncbi:exodeoxyribonuclease VII small subunit [Allobranchiibius huperziae]|uniref:Exodeoxyribonuclease 7 small subunit n=1 Tax=Allobranchiibius huperziae TaxID=1874116 RepID=A0A853DHZ2_9MICO|nr:exodeoxyribonuclease VII small subunit [Allobranchiibius huperziae]NYJ75643.1 exodeoxyribonuclease VII small subunit [Allobranchiibius huperziae]
MATSEQQAADGADEVPAADAHDDIAHLGYEDARDQLAAIVTRLESGEPSLEDSMRLWERGEALAAHCQKWLSNAEQRIDAMTADRD